MRLLIRSELSAECEKLIRRHYDYLHQLHENSLRVAKRLDALPAKKIRIPRYWSLDRRFNPFSVRTRRHLALYSYTLDRVLRAHQYRPEPAVTHYIPKEDGSKRELNIFQVPDAALSRLVYKSLLHKNLNRYSSYAYAYREDRNAHDAIREMHLEWKTLDRVYVAEFDFTKFFDNISHAYLWRVLEKHGFLYTPEEAHVLDAFLTSDAAEVRHYGSGPFKHREKGIPQGTSVSLFLANVACWELDRSLERIGVGFSRYADDTVVWSNSYQKVVQAYDLIRRHGEMMEVPINELKSQGIHLVVKESRGEIATKKAVDYLGYRVSLSNVSIKDSRLSKIKKQITYLAYVNLLQPLKVGTFNVKRLTDIDLDFVVALGQIRRYLYGGLDDEKLRKYLRGQTPRINFKGVMSYLPLVDDAAQLAKLDGWLIHVLKRSLRLRAKLWKAAVGLLLPGPNPDWIDDLADVKVWKGPSGNEYDLRIPSFTLINKAMQLAIRRSGITAAASPLSTYYT